MTLLDSAVERLRAARVERPRAEARLLLAHALGVNREAIVAGDIAPGASGLARFKTVLARRVGREPFAYIVGRREFWSLDFAVGPGVLIPRPETETLVEEALKRFHGNKAPLRVLDLGTGSGCLLLAFLSERKNARGVGLDLSADALRWATRNARGLGLADRVQLLEGDWAEAPEGPFDVIFANPPYVASRDLGGLEPEISVHEPRIALDGGTDGLDDYRRIALVLERCLATSGRAFIEIGEGQAAPVGELFSSAGLAIEAAVADLSSFSRCLVTVFAPEACPSSRKKDLEIAARRG